jgi:hypothetical protein
VNEEYLSAAKEGTELAESESIKVPLENRIAYLAIDGDPINEWMSPTTIADLVGTNIYWVRRTAKRFGIETKSDESMVHNARSYELYPPLTFELLNDEYLWRKSYLQLDKYIGSAEIAEFIGRSIGWTKKTLESMGVKGQTTKHDSRKFIGYPKTVVKELRDINLYTPLDNGWFTVLGLVETTGCDREWVERRLMEAGIESEERRSGLSGRIFDYYPPSAIETIGKAVENRPKAAGEWLTARAMAEVVPLSYTWVNKRLDEKYQEVGELRQDDQRVSRDHYPPAVLTELIAEAEKRLECQPVGDYLPISVVARKVGHHVLWVTNRLAFIDSKAEPRVDGQGRMLDCYPLEAVDELLDLPNNILKA